jgi:hypothetical protein
MSRLVRASRALGLFLPAVALACSDDGGSTPHGQARLPHEHTAVPPSGGAGGTASGGSAGEPSHVAGGSAGASHEGAGGAAPSGAGGAAGSGGDGGDGSDGGVAGAGDKDPGVVDELSFAERAIDDTITGENKAVGDINGDGLLDILVGGPLLRWYEAPSYTPHDVKGSDGYLTSHMQVADMNGDGALDVVSPDDFEVYWFENPLGQGGKLSDAWPRHLVGDHGELVHELWVVDLNLDGKLDIVGNPSLEVWIQGKDADTFTSVDLSAFAHDQGLAVGFVDQDQRPDLVVRGQWLQTPADPTDPDAYVAHPVDSDLYESSSIHVADLDDNGTPDLIYAPMEVGAGDLVWYSASSSDGPWQKHRVGGVSYVHDFAVVDIDQKGRPDIVFAEMNPSPTRRVGAFLNHGQDDWSLDVIATTGSHNIVLADLGNDCDLDIVGSNWEAPPVEIWENLASPAGTSCSH